jgi:hypothetical protein
MTLSFVGNQLLLRISGGQKTNVLNDRSLSSLDVSQAPGSLFNLVTLQSTPDVCSYQVKSPATVT